MEPESKANDDGSLPDNALSDDDNNQNDEAHNDAKVSPAVVNDIQMKLLQKVLPILERHLSEHRDKQSVRGFVSECYVKTIRKLPYDKFIHCLQRLIN